MICQTVYGTLFFPNLSFQTHTAKCIRRCVHTCVHLWKFRRQHRTGNTVVQLCEFCSSVSCDILWGEEAVFTLTSSSVFETVLPANSLQTADSTLHRKCNLHISKCVSAELKVCYFLRTSYIVPSMLPANSWPCDLRQWPTWCTLALFYIYLLNSSTCFEHYMLIISRMNCIDALSGIVLQMPNAASIHLIFLMMSI